MPATKPRRPLQCYRCVAARRPYELTVERGQQRRKRGGKQRIHVNVHCTRGHEWWSTHPEAVAESRRLDAQAGELV